MKERQVDIQTDRETDRQTDRQTYRQTEKKIGRDAQKMPTLSTKRHRDVKKYILYYIIL